MRDRTGMKFDKTSFLSGGILSGDHDDCRV